MVGKFALHAPGSNQILSLNEQKKKKAHLAKSSLYVYKSYKQKGILRKQRMRVFFKALSYVSSHVITIRLEVRDSWW